MPTYNYECRGCGHAFELFQSIKAPVKRKCPKCGKLKLDRLIGTGAGVLFKGSGFYQTDYRSKSYQSGEKAAKGDDGGKPESSKTESNKPDAPKPPSEGGKPKNKRDG